MSKYVVLVAMDSHPIFISKIKFDDFVMEDTVERMEEN